MSSETSSAGANEERELLYHLFIHHVEDFAIFMLDGVGRVATWNIGVERVLGYRTKEIIGQPLARFYPEDDVRRGVPDQELRDAVTNGKASDDRWLVRKDGTMILGQWGNGSLKRAGDMRLWQNCEGSDQHAERCREADEAHHRARV